MSSPQSQHNQSVSSLQRQQQLEQQQQQQQLQQQPPPPQHIYSNQQLLLHHSNYSMESEEGDIEDNRPPSLNSSKSNLTENSMDHHSIHSAAMRGKVTPSLQKVHQFLVRTFSSPTKCNHCTSLMVSTQSNNNKKKTFFFPL